MHPQISSHLFPLPALSHPWQPVRPILTDDPDVGIQFDEYLLQQLMAGERGPCFCIRRVPRCLVVTRREERFAGFEDASRVLESVGWPVVVRCSGGSCVPQGEGVLNLSLLFPKPQSWQLEDGYRLLCGIFARLLASYGLKGEEGEVPGSFCDGRYNLQVDGRKLLGTAQRWAGSNRDQSAVLAHACLLVEPDLAEATAAVNRFYHLCGQPQRFDPQACTSLRESLGSQVEMDLMANVTQRLNGLLHEMFNL